MSKLESEQEKARAAVIKYVKEAYRASVNTRVPSLRGDICKHVKDELGIQCYPDKLKPCFPPELDGYGPLMKRICRASGVQYPNERVRLTKKALRGKKEKTKKRAKGKVEPEEKLVATEFPERPNQKSRIEDIKRSIEMEKAQQSYRAERAKELAEEVELLASDPEEKISGPVLAALGKVVPKILEDKYGVSDDLATIHKCWPELLQFFAHWGQNVTATVLCEWSYLTTEEKETFKELCMIQEKAGPQVSRIGQLLTIWSEWSKLPDDMRKLIEAFYETYVKSGMYPQMKDAITMLELHRLFSHRPAH